MRALWRVNPRLSREIVFNPAVKIALASTVPLCYRSDRQTEGNGKGSVNLTEKTTKTIIGGLIVLNQSLNCPAAPALFDGRALWSAVIVRAVDDATTLNASLLGSGGRAGDGIRVRQEARDWLTGGGRDFREVCELAGLDPAGVQRRMLSIADAGWPREALDDFTVRPGETCGVPYE